ncbi:hypothetical protein FRC00_011122 [Tulasnella sp. 408]|nr:hypothetical protein FRC00_011122 [Tulasnella sp. 408]
MAIADMGQIVGTSTLAQALRVSGETKHWTRINSPESVKKDLTRGDERPEWLLSTYGPAKHEPTYITGTDLSPEEMRVRAYEARAQNRLDYYNLFEASQFQQAENIVADRLKDPRATFKHIAEQGSIGSNGLTSVKAPATLAFPAPTAEFGPNKGGPGTSISLFKAAKPATFGSSIMPAFSQPSTLHGPLQTSAPLADFPFTAESVKKDLTRGDERPEWPLSTYGPAKHQPTYITGTDLSPEEMRVRAYEVRAQKSLDKYGLFEAAQFQQAEKIVADLLKDPMATFKHITDRGSVGPNGLAWAQTPATSAFHAPTTPAFGFTDLGSNVEGFGSNKSLFRTAKPAAFGSPTMPTFGHTGTSRASERTSASGARTTSTPASDQAAATTPAFGQAPVSHNSDALKPATSAGGTTTTPEMTLSAVCARPAAFGASTTTTATVRKSDFETSASTTIPPSGQTGFNQSFQNQAPLVSPSQPQEVAGSPLSATPIIDPSVIPVSNAVPDNSVLASLGRSGELESPTRSSIRIPTM